ncbi:hypothetical protein ACFUIW_08580 [Streptomyces sp. NPDC057245]|uniref:hypothetical protein n=1 Tax=Streptomyces sp. NPDC057245 TaxID=3346065 RepID=UPI003628A209
MSEPRTRGELQEAVAMHEYDPGLGRQQGKKARGPGLQGASALNLQQLAGNAAVGRLLGGDGHAGGAAAPLASGGAAPDILAVQRLAGNAAVGRGLGAGRKAAPGRRGAAGSAAPVQRALRVGSLDYSKEYKERTDGLAPHQHEAVLNELVNHAVGGFRDQAARELSREEQAMFDREERRIAQQLRKVIVSPVGQRGNHPVLKQFVGVNEDFGAKNRDVRVNNYTELARNLMGWVYAKEKRHQEKNAAEHVQREGEVEIFLNVLLRRIHRMAEGMKGGMTGREAKIMDHELATGLSHIESQPIKHGRYDASKANRPIGSYLAYFDGRFNKKFEGTSLETLVADHGGFLALMQNPEKFGFRDKMIALHDLSEYFGHSRHTPPGMGKEHVPEIDQDDTWSTAGYDHHGNRVVVQDRGQNPVVKPDGSVKEHPSTRNENSNTTRLARSRNIPVWAGQSYTAARMYKMAAEAGASKEEIAAVGWGIFSFWRINFDHTTEFAYHTLHEVMDIAQNFGVPYDVDDQYASLGLPKVQRIADKLVGVRNSTDAAYEDVRSQIRAMERQMSRPNRMTLDHEEHFLRVAYGVQDELEDIRANLQERVERFARWQQLSSRERTKLVTYCLNHLRETRQRMNRLSSRLAAMPR